MLVKFLVASYLWTVVEGGVGDDQWIIPVYHFVNRICYLVTEKSHQGLPRCNCFSVLHLLVRPSAAVAQRGSCAMCFVN